MLRPTIVDLVLCPIIELKRTSTPERHPLHPFARGCNAKDNVVDRCHNGDMNAMSKFRPAACIMMYTDVATRGEPCQHASDHALLWNTKALKYRLQLW